MTRAMSEDCWRIYWKRAVAEVDRLRTENRNLRNAIKMQAIKTMYYNGHGTNPNKVAVNPGYTYLWEEYLCNEAWVAMTKGLDSERESIKSVIEPLVHQVIAAQSESWRPIIDSHNLHTTDDALLDLLGLLVDEVRRLRGNFNSRIEELKTTLNRKKDQNDE